MTIDPVSSMGILMLALMTGILLQQVEGRHRRGLWEHLFMIHPVRQRKWDILQGDIQLWNRNIRIKIGIGLHWTTTRTEQFCRVMTGWEKLAEGTTMTNMKANSCQPPYIPTKITQIKKSIGKYQKSDKNIKSCQIKHWEIHKTK